jgi:Photoprotection regulator fluorescence recovery protein
MHSPFARLRTSPSQNEGMWSRSEKAIARTTFDAALKRELQELIQQAKRMVSQISAPDDLWNLERYLTERRKEIDRKYEFRPSRLTDVLGRLLYEGRINEEELRGLPEDKLKAIRSFANFLREDAVGF